MISETIDLLGRKATDKVTGAAGVIISVSFDLFGCVQAAISPPAKEGKRDDDTRWYDSNRLVVDTEAPRVMEVPNFDGPQAGEVGAVPVTPANYSHGPANKASPRGG